MLERTILDGWPGLAETKTISAQTGSKRSRQVTVDHHQSAQNSSQEYFQTSNYYQTCLTMLMRKKQLVDC